MRWVRLIRFVTAWALIRVGFWVMGDEMQDTVAQAMREEARVRAVRKARNN